MKNCSTCQATYPDNFTVCPRDGSKLLEIGTWMEGSVIRGKYRILGKVGQGGMGAVYMALHLAFDEVRALKVIAPQLMSDELFVKRFTQEAVVTRKLQHPNAVRVDDIDEAEDGRPFIVMEYIEGESLKKLIQEQGAIPVPRVCAVIKQAAAALEAAHGLGMVHRDIKPDNIVLVKRPEGEQAKVLDFGIAKIKEARAGATSGMTLTGTGVVIGTPQYMSPEQAMGKRGNELDGRSDLYSLGVVMYQMLTGDLPFKADTTMEMLIAHIQKPPTPIRTLRPELQLPDAIANVVMRTLEKNPDARPADARALIEEIEQAEKEIVPMGATRVVRPTTVVSPGAAPRAQAAVRAGGGPASSPAAAPQPRPATPPRPAPVARPGAVPTAAPPRQSRVGLWATIAILVVGLSGGAWYYTTQRTRVEPETPKTIPAPPPRAQPASETPATESTTSKPEPVTNPPATNTEPPTSQRNNTPTRTPKRSGETSAPIIPVGRPTTSTPRTVPEREAEPPKPVVDTKAVSRAIAMGDLYFTRGEYENAIRHYEEGLGADPSNATLRNKLDRAQKAKAAEGRVLQ